MNVTFALSASNFIDDFGAYAGFAAFVALALVALLIFSQARELRRLRDWGAMAHDRIAELERGLAQAMELARRPAPAPRQAVPATGQPAQRGPVRRVAPDTRVPAPAVAAARTSAPVRPVLLPSAPVGVAGPALASATVLIPLPGTPPSTRETVVPEAAPQPRRTVAPAAQPAVAAAATRQEAVPTPATAHGREAVAPQPADAGNGYHEDEPAAAPPPSPRREPVPAARTAAAGGPPRRGAERPGQRRAQPAAALRQSGSPSRAAGRPGGPPAGGSLLDEPPHNRRRVFAVLGVVLAFAVVIGVGFVLLTGGDDEPARTQRVQAPLDGTGEARGQARRAATEQRAASPAPAPDDVTVAVLNGTPTEGLATSIATDLAADGYQQGVVTNASDPDRTVTVVEYRNGERAAAEAVARALNLPADAVMSIDPASEQIACSTTPCTATVVVTVGADKQPQQ